MVKKVQAEKSQNDRQTFGDNIYKSKETDQNLEKHKHVSDGY
jgi:hypothetical protein